MKTLKKTQFTLIEIMIAIVIFSLSVVGLYSTMLVARSAQVSAKNRLHAMKLVTERLEELQQAPYNKLVNLADTIEKVPLNQMTTNLAEDITDYSPQLDLLDAYIVTTGSPAPDSTSSDRVWRVDCTVTWNNASSGALMSEGSYIYVYDTEVK